MHMYISMKTLTLTALNEIVKNTTNQALKIKAQQEISFRMELVINHIKKAV